MLGLHWSRPQFEQDAFLSHLCPESKDTGEDFESGKGHRTKQFRMKPFKPAKGMGHVLLLVVFLFEFQVLLSIASTVLRSLGLVLWSLGSFLQRGRGLPAGPLGLLGLSEGISYLAARFSASDCSLFACYGAGI